MNEKRTTPMRAKNEEPVISADNVHFVTVEMPEIFHATGLDKLFRLCKFANLNKKEQMVYLNEFMRDLDRKSQLRTARNEGLAEGKAEQTRIIARNMIAADMPIEVVMSTTGLSAGEIESL